MPNRELEVHHGEGRRLERCESGRRIKWHARTRQLSGLRRRPSPMRGHNGDRRALGTTICRAGLEKAFADHKTRPRGVAGKGARSARSIAFKNCLNQAMRGATVRPQPPGETSVQALLKRRLLGTVEGGRRRDSIRRTIQTHRAPQRRLWLAARAYLRSRLCQKPRQHAEI